MRSGSFLDYGKASGRFPRYVVATSKSRAGHAPPLPGGEFYYPVGRGDLTPPGKWAVGTNLPFACRGEHCSPVRFTR